MNLETLRSLIKTLEEEGVVDNPRKAFRINEFTREGWPGFSFVCANELVSNTIDLLEKELSTPDASLSKAKVFFCEHKSFCNRCDLSVYRCRELFQSHAHDWLDMKALFLKKQITIAQRFLANA